MNKKSERALPWLKVSMQYLIVTEFLLDIICSNKNSHSYFGDQIDDESLSKKLESNAGNLFYPLMFNFFHALEIIYKGLLVLHGKSIGKSHRLEYLLSCVKKLDISNENKKLLGEYVENLDTKFPEFKSWLVDSNRTIDEFYLFLKYPTLNEDLELYNNEDIFWKGEKALPFYESMRCDVHNLRKFIVGHYWLKVGENKSD